MTATGGSEGDFDAIAAQLAGSTECASASMAMSPDYGPDDDGPEIILHCNLKYGHDGDHEFTTQWPRDEKEREK